MSQLKLLGDWPILPPQYKGGVAPTQRGHTLTNPPSKESQPLHKNSDFSCGECTGSLSTSEIKWRRARSVLGWGTAWEDLRVLSALIPEEVKVPIRNHVSKTPSRDSLLPHIQVCQSQPFKRDPDMHKVQLRVSSDFHHIACFVLKAFVLVGGSIQFGPAPRTALEIQTQEALDAVRSFR